MIYRWNLTCPFSGGRKRWLRELPWVVAIQFLDRPQMTVERFGKVLLNPTDIFIRTKLSFGFVNLKPILPGHILVSPKRVVPRFSDLTTDEVQDLFLCVHRIAPVLEKVYDGTSMTIAVQDGPDAGQSIEVPPVKVIVDVDFCSMCMFT